MIGVLHKRAEVYVNLAEQRNILKLPNCGYYPVNATLFQVGSRMPVCVVTSIGSSGNWSMTLKRSSYIWNGMREKATGTRFSFSACYLVLAPHSSTLTYSVRRRAHLSSLGLRSRLRKGNVSSNQPITTKTKRQLMPTTRINSLCRIFPVHIHEFIFRGPSTVSNFIGR